MYTSDRAASDDKLVRMVFNTADDKAVLSVLLMRQTKTENWFTLNIEIVNI